MSATFTSRPAVHSLRVRWLMEKQQKAEIGERIRDLRDNSAETNRSIADYCDVGERTVAAWIAGDGIKYDNAKKVAELFEVDVDYIWRGKQKSETPDVLGALDGSSADVVALKRQLDGIEDKLDKLLSHFDLAELEELAADPPPARVRRSSGKARKRA